MHEKSIDGFHLRHETRLVPNECPALLKARFLRLWLAVGTDDNLLDFFLRRFQRLFAMGLQGRAALIKRD